MTISPEAREVVAINVKRLREEKDLSVPEAATAIGVHRSYWNLLEKGTLNFTIEKLEKVADALETTVQDLLNPRSGNGHSKKRESVQKK